MFLETFDFCLSSYTVLSNHIFFQDLKTVHLARFSGVVFQGEEQNSQRNKLKTTDHDMVFKLSQNVVLGHLRIVLERSFQGVHKVCLIPILTLQYVDKCACEPKNGGNPGIIA